MATAGHANQIKAVAPGSPRATVAVNLELLGQGLDGAPLPPVAINRNIEMYGPGDIIGIENRAIFKNEPRNWIIPT